MTHAAHSFLKLTQLKYLCACSSLGKLRDTLTENSLKHELGGLKIKHLHDLILYSTEAGAGGKNRFLSLYANYASMRVHM